jgi:hypothetical protein
MDICSAIMPFYLGFFVGFMYDITVAFILELCMWFSMTNSVCDSVLKRIKDWLARNRNVSEWGDMLTRGLMLQ